MQPDLTALISKVQGLAQAIQNNVNALAGAGPADTLARNSASAALASKGSATTSQTNAAASATAAANSASSASTSASTASTKAGNAATSATSAGSSATAASTSATNAANSNSTAQSLLTSIQKYKQTSPVANAASTTGAASTTWNATCSFTAPCNGWVFALGTYNQYQPGSSGYQCNLLINGNNVSTDTTVQSQRHMGYLYVSAGTAVTVQMQAVSQSTAPLQGGTLHVVAWFSPAP